MRLTNMLVLGRLQPLSRQGNLVHRAVNLCHKFCGGVVPELDLSGGWGPYPLPFDLETLRGKVEEAMRSSYNIKVGYVGGTLCASALTCMAGVVWQLLGDEGMSAMRDTNKFLTDAAPWAMKGDDRDLDRKMVSHSLTQIALCSQAQWLCSQW